MNTPLREAIQREIRTREANRAASGNEKLPERSPRPEFHGASPDAASQAPFQAEAASAPQGQGFPELKHGAPGATGASARFAGHPLPTTRAGGRQIATAKGGHRTQGERGAGRKL